MSPFRVFLHEWDWYDVILKARSAEEAIRKAEALYREQGLDAFSHHDCGDDGFTAEAYAS